MWNTTASDGTARAAVRSQSREQALKSKRRASPEIRAIMLAFDCDVSRARKILAAARRQS